MYRGFYAALVSRNDVSSVKWLLKVSMNGIIKFQRCTSNQFLITSLTPQRPFSHLF